MHTPGVGWGPGIIPLLDGCGYFGVACKGMTNVPVSVANHLSWCSHVSCVLYVGFICHVLLLGAMSYVFSVMSYAFVCVML